MNRDLRNFVTGAAGVAGIFLGLHWLASAIPLDGHRNRHLQQLGRFIDHQVVDPLGVPAALLLLAAVSVFSGWLIMTIKREPSEPRPKAPKAPKASKNPKAAPSPVQQAPDPALARRMAAAATPRTPPPEVDRSRPILVTRRPRKPGGDWAAARSWFGGLPRLAGRPWPKTSTGKPMTFLAQIDLGELAAAAPAAPIRHQGALAFFIGPGPQEWEAAVVPTPGGGGETAPPRNGAKTHEATGEMFPEEPTPWARDRFIRWPVQFTAFHIPHVPVDSVDDEQIEEADRIYWEHIRARFHRPDFPLGAREVLAELGDNDPRFWWRGVQIYADQLRVDALRRSWIDRAREPHGRNLLKKIHALRTKRTEAVDPDEAAQIDADLAATESQRAAFEAHTARLDGQSARIGAFIAKVEAVLAGRDPWAAMTTDELASFEKLQKRARDEFPDILRNRHGRKVGDLMVTTLLEMFTGDEAAFAALPATVRDHINRNHLLTSGPIHQMFGPGDDIQAYAVPENADKHLLLKLGYDAMMNWAFGDVGVYHFWITPADLAAGNWKAVTLTFEAH